MKVKLDRLGAALDRPSGDTRLFLLHGADEAGAMALADRLGRAMGAGAERIALEGATLKSDPARLADEAAAVSLFGDARWIRVTAAGEESLAAAQALLDAGVAGNPVVMIAPSLRTTAKLVKLAESHTRAMAYACYPPDERQGDALARELAQAAGLRLAHGVGQRLFAAADGDRAILAREIEKLALYLDAAPDRPQEADAAALDTIGAGQGDGAVDALVTAVLARAPREVAAELRLLALDTVAVPLLRAAVRRLMTLAELRARIDAGEAPQDVTARVFFKEQASTQAALRRWSSAEIDAALRAMRAAERQLMASNTAGTASVAEALLALARTPATAPKPR